MEQPKLGQLCSGNEGRDAVHVAIVPVRAFARLQPGDKVGFATDDKIWVDRSFNPIGIVDPFLEENSINAGDWIYLCLYPGSVTSLRHVWTHPAFTSKPPHSATPGDEFDPTSFG